MDKNQKKLIKENIDKTMSSFRQLDDNIWMLEYKSDYALDKMLSKVHVMTHN